MTLEQLISMVNARALRINNLCQLPDGSWQANLTNGTDFWDFGKAQTAVGALAAAMHKVMTEEPGPGEEPKPSPAHPSQARVLTLADIGL